MGSCLGSEIGACHIYQADDGTIIKYYKTASTLKISYLGYWWTHQKGNTFTNLYLRKSFTLTETEKTIIMTIKKQVKYFYFVGMEQKN